VDGGGEVDDVTRRVLKGPKIRMTYPGSISSSRRSDALTANSSVAWAPDRWCTLEVFDDRQA